MLISSSPMMEDIIGAFVFMTICFSLLGFFYLKGKGGNVVRERRICRCGKSHSSVDVGNMADHLTCNIKYISHCRVKTNDKSI